MPSSENHESKVSGGFKWPFSLETFYMTEEYRATPLVVRKATEHPQADSNKRTQRRYFRWPFSLDAFHATETYRVPVSPKKEILLVSILRSKYGIQLGEQENEMGDVSVADRLLPIFVESHFDTIPRSFAPEGSLKRILTPRAIINELENIDWESSKDADLVAGIYLHGMKLFATAVQIGITGKPLLDLMRALSESGLSDDNLPLRADTFIKYHLIDRKIFSKADERRFIEEQWRFQAPVFSTKHCSLDTLCIIPITRREELQKGEFSSVYKVSIHESHVDHPKAGSKNRQVVALQQMLPARYSNDIHGFATERKRLIQLESLKHPHIHSFLGSFTRGSDNFLLFEWTDRGTLRDFWCEKKPILDSEFITWMFKQYRGLADAINEVNKIGMRHGDLKPETILSFEDGSTNGCLRIGGWDWAKSDDTKDDLRNMDTIAAPRAAMYKAPEEQGQSFHAQRSNVWSLGCIYLEFIVWLLHGEDQRKRFVSDLRDAQNHRYHRISNEQWIGIAHIWINRMAQDERCKSTRIGDVLELIRNTMLVIDLNNPLSESKEQQSTDLSVTGDARYELRRPWATRAYAKDIVYFLDIIHNSAIRVPENYVKESAQEVFHGPERREHVTSVEEQPTESSSKSSTDSSLRLVAGLVSHPEASESPKKASQPSEEVTLSSREEDVSWKSDSTQRISHSASGTTAATHHQE